MTDDIASFTGIYGNDINLSQSRLEDHRAALEATNQAIVYMEALLVSPDDASDGQQFLQLPENSAVLTQLRSLTEMAAGADQGAVATIIGMLEDIATNLQLSIDAEGSNEGDATAHYNSVKGRMEGTLQDLKDAKAALDAEIEKQDGIFNDETENFDEADRLWTSTKALLEAKEEECRLWEEEYNNNKLKRVDERDIIAQCRELFQEYPESEFAEYFDSRNE